MAFDYSEWREVTPEEPKAGVFVLIGTRRNSPMVAIRCNYVTKYGQKRLTDEFIIPASGNRIRQLKTRPIYWLPIKGGMKCEE